MSGWISVDRSAFPALINGFPKRLRERARSFWIECLLRANWKDGWDGRARDSLLLKKGQFPFGREEFSSSLGCSVQQLRTIVKEFKNRGELVTKSTNRGTIVTVVNYAIYVPTGGDDNQRDNQHRYSKSPAVNREPSTHEESEESKELEEPKEDEHERELRPHISKIVEFYQEAICPDAKETESATVAIKARLNSFSVEELFEAIESFSQKAWWMENKSKMGIAWFFKSDDQIERFINLTEIDGEDWDL